MGLGTKNEAEENQGPIQKALKAGGTSVHHL